MNRQQKMMLNELVDDSDSIKCRCPHCMGGLLIGGDGGLLIGGYDEGGVLMGGYDIGESIYGNALMGGKRGVAKNPATDKRRRKRKCVKTKVGVSGKKRCAKYKILSKSRPKASRQCVLTKVGASGKKRCAKYSVSKVKKVSDWQKFVKKNMKKIIDERGNTPQETMGLLGEAWRDSGKNLKIANEILMEV